MGMIEDKPDKPEELGFPLGYALSWGFPHPHLPTYILRFFIFLCYGNFFIFTLIFFQFLISYFKLTCYFEFFSKLVTSYSNLSLIVEAQGAPGHATL